jgi:hypothetical protein
MHKIYLIILVLIWSFSLYYLVTINDDNANNSQTVHNHNANNSQINQNLQIVSRPVCDKVIPYDCSSCYIPKQISESCFNKRYNHTGNYKDSIKACYLPRKMSESCLNKKCFYFS